MPFNVNLLVCAWREWNTRYKELVGFRQWLDQFSHWLNLTEQRTCFNTISTLNLLRLMGTRR